MKHSALVLLVATLAAATGAQADVRVRHHAQTLGIAAVGDVDTKITETYSGQKRRAESVTNVTGGVVGFLTKKDQTSTVITRLDKGVQWTLIPDDKEYKEVSLDELAKKLQKLQGKPEHESEGEKRTRYEVKVETPDEHKTIAGFDARHVRVLVTVFEDDPKTGASRETGYLTTDMWLAEAAAPAYAEVTAYALAYAKRIGVSGDLGDNPLLASMMGKVTGLMKQAESKMQGISGMPLYTETTIESPGAVAERKEEKEESTPTSPGGLLGSLFGGKKKHEEEPSGPKPTAPGRKVDMKITDEVLEVSTDSQAADAFEIPAGWSKD